MAIRSVSSDCGCTRYTYTKERNSTKDAVKAGAFIGGVWGALKKPTYYKGSIEVAEGAIQKIVFSNRPNNILKGAVYGAAFMFLFDCIFGKNKTVKKECINNCESPKHNNKPQEVNVVNMVNIATNPDLTIDEKVQKQMDYLEKLDNEEKDLRELEKNTEDFEDIEPAVI